MLKESMIFLRMFKFYFCACLFVNSLFAVELIQNVCIALQEEILHSRVEAFLVLRNNEQKELIKNILVQIAKSSNSCEIDKLGSYRALRNGKVDAIVAEVVTVLQAYVRN